MYLLRQLEVWQIIVQDYWFNYRRKHQCKKYLLGSI